MKVHRLESMEALVCQIKSLVLIILNQKQNFAWVCIIILIIVTCLLIEKKSLNLNVNFPTQFRLGSISNGFSAIESRHVSLNENMHDFLFD